MGGNLGMTTTRASRKRQRRADNEALAKDARFWRGLKSADRIHYSQPVNRQAAKDLRKGKTK